MTARSEKPAHICQWCHQPIKGEPTWWNRQPQCRNPITCETRRRKKETPK
ncbi:hypothetical protein [Streptomyces sp. A1277]|nr:hypothetical protein [Streptomyces sp. A1277]